MHRFIIFILIFPLLISGCVTQEKITTYTVQKENKVEVDFFNPSSVLSAFLSAQLLNDQTAQKQLLSTYASQNYESLFNDLTNYDLYQTGVVRYLDDYNRDIIVFLYKKQGLKALNIVAKYDYGLFWENERWLVHSSFKLNDIKTGNFEINSADLIKIQTEVDDGRQTWRLDPLESIKKQGQIIGFYADDKYSEFNRENNTFLITHNSLIYQAHLYQPAKIGEKGIWAISAVEINLWGGL